MLKVKLRHQIVNQNFTYTNDWLTGDVYDSNGSTRMNGPSIVF